MALLHTVCDAAGTNWTSGALYDDAQRDAAAAAEAKRLQDLKANEELPLVYLDVSIQGKPVGRIHFVLFTKESPRAGVQGTAGTDQQTGCGSVSVVSSNLGLHAAAQCHEQAVACSLPSHD